MSQYHVPEVPRSIYNQENKFQIPDEIVSYIADRPVEYIPNKGIIIHIVGATYPKKGFPTPESIGALNIIKTVIKESLRFPHMLILVNKNKLLNTFNTIFNKAFAPYKLSKQYLCPAAHHTCRFLEKFFIDVGINKDIAEESAYNLCHIMEYDDAYRYRVQDICTEADLQQLRFNTRKEIKRLLNIYLDRESGFFYPRVAPGITRVAQQMKYFGTLVLILMVIPRVKKAFSKNVHILDNVRYDEADKYWAYLKHGDYQFGGMSYEERTNGWQIPVPYKITGL